MINKPDRFWKKLEDWAANYLILERSNKSSGYFLKIIAVSTKLHTKVTRFQFLFAVPLLLNTQMLQL